MSKILLKLAAVILALGAGYSLQAQTVTGTVKDSAGEPVAGAFVLIQGTTQGTSADLDGVFSLEVGDAQNAVLEVSMVGLQTAVVKVAGRATVDVVLAEDATLLEETVVVGYATVKRRDVLGSVSSVSADKLAEQPVTTVSQALSGKMAGVSVTTSEGDPDAEIKIRVRGGGSITQDNSPLYIVDGFPVESINDIASSEIASIDVLKDAFSTAIYGSRGANGVVIVTTKGAEKGRKISVNLNAYYGQKYMANADALQAMDAENFVKFQYELAKVRDNVSDNYTPYFGTFEDIDLYKGQPTNNWVDSVFGNTGSTFNTDFSISGSGDNYSWTLGYAHMGDNAIMSGSNYTRDNLNFKGHFGLGKTTSIDANVRYSNTRVRGAGANGINDTGTTSGNGRLKHCISYTPIPIATTTGIEEEQDYGDNAPPLQSVADNDSKRARRIWDANAAFNWEIIKNLKLKIEGGLEDYNQGDERFYGTTTYYVNNSSTYRGVPANQTKEYYKRKIRNTNTLHYDFSEVIKNNDHNLDLLVGEEMTITKANTLTLMNENYPSFFGAEDAWNFLSSGTAVSNSRIYEADDNLLSFFGRVNYDYKHRYSVSATFRADGSSKFTGKNKWGYFPSAAASWTLSNEEWMRNVRGVNHLKIRYSFGTAGNNNIPTGQVDRVYYETATSWLSNHTSYISTDQLVNGKIVSIKNNPDLKWETTYSHNIGIDFAFWKNRINGSIELYQNDTKDLLINYPVAGSGYSTQYQNIGSTRNRGVELTLNLPILTMKDYSVNLSGNIAYNKNVVTDLGGIEKITAQSYWASTDVGVGDDYIVQVGQALGNMYGYQCAGRYEVDDFQGYINGKWVLKDGVADCSSIIGSNYLMPGALKLKDLDNDGKVTTQDRTIIGNANPDFTGGFSLNAFIKGFDICANFNYAIGNDVYNANKIEFTSSRKYSNRNLINTMDVDKRWTNIDWSTGELITDPETLKSVNAGTTMWSPCIGSAVFSDWAVEDASYLRLQSATIGYTLPEKWLDAMHLRKIRLYVTGTNLFCATKYTGYDPEVDTRRSTPLTPGVDYSAYPKSIGWVVGLNVTF